LQQADIVREVKGKHPNGRKPIVLEINPAKGYVAGVDIGATHITVLLANYSAQVVDELERSAVISDGPQKILGQVSEMIEELSARSGIKKESIHAVGVGVPGPVVNGTGMVSDPPIMPGWNHVLIDQLLYSKLGIPVTVCNDAELGAVGEWAYGAGRGERNLIYVKVGMGIGAGILIDGSIYHGATGSAGEIGHITLDENGPMCSCGNKGCLEAMAGGKAVAMNAIQAIKNGGRSSLTGLKPLESITSHDVIDEAFRGDLLCQQIMVDAGYHLGTAIAGLVNMFNPSIVIIGGNMARIGDLMLEPIRKTVQERSLRLASSNLRIATALLGRRSSGMGAIVEALNLVIHQSSVI
jgi:glucokinase-like ROK family protein